MTWFRETSSAVARRASFLGERRQRRLAVALGRRDEPKQLRHLLVQLGDAHGGRGRVRRRPEQVRDGLHTVEDRHDASTESHVTRFDSVTCPRAGVWRYPSRSMRVPVRRVACSSMALAAVLACSARRPDSRSPPSPPAPVAVSQTVVAHADLGADVVAVAPEPGRYGALLVYHQYSSCSQSWSDYSARSTFVLSLDAGGDATACRGRQARHAGPDFTEGLAEQQGYRGRWSREGPWVSVTLDLDPGTCPQRRGYTNLAPRPWRLRCTGVEPSPSHPNLTTAVLACQPLPESATERTGYAMTGFLPGEWLLLGPGNGVQAETDEGALTPGVTGPRATLTRAPSRIEGSEWEQGLAPAAPHPPRD